MTKGQYVEYLLATPGNYTCTNLAAHLEGEQGQSHDAISNFLRREKFTPRGLWQVVQPLLHDGPDCYLVFDDSVQDKRYSHKIELVKRQYSGAEGGLVRGIGVLNLLHSSGAATQAGQFYPVDYRIYDPEGDGKTISGPHMLGIPEIQRDPAASDKEHEIDGGYIGLTSFFRGIADAELGPEV